MTNFLEKKCESVFQSPVVAAVDLAFFVIVVVPQVGVAFGESEWNLVETAAWGIVMVLIFQIFRQPIGRLVKFVNSDKLPGLVKEIVEVIFWVPFVMGIFLGAFAGIAIFGLNILVSLYLFAEYLKAGELTAVLFLVFPVVISILVARLRKSN